MALTNYTYFDIIAFYMYGIIMGSLLVLTLPDSQASSLSGWSLYVSVEFPLGTLNCTVNYP